MSIKNSLHFYSHSICIKSTFVILDNHSASKTITCGVLRILKKKKNGETPKILCFSRRWTKCRRKEYNISLKHPNKRFSITQNEWKERVINFLKNIWTTRYWFVKKYNIEQIIKKADQMPLLRNEVHGKKLCRENRWP